MRLSVVEALAGHQEPGVVAALLRLADQDRDIRRWAIRVLADRRQPEVTRALIRHLGDRDTTVRIAAIEALAGRDDDGVTQALLGCLTARARGVRLFAYKVLAGRDDPRILVWLCQRRHLLSPSSTTRNERFDLADAIADRVLPHDASRGPAADPAPPRSDDQASSDLTSRTTRRETMDPVSLILGALASGAAQGIGDSVADAVAGRLQPAMHLLSGRFTGNQAAEVALVEHAHDAETWQAPLAKALDSSGASADPAVIKAAQDLMALLDEPGSRTGKYHVDLRGAQGVQVGDSNQQANVFTTRPDQKLTGHQG